ncbi:MAG: Spy/CpxP family protein refolding chaperone [Mesorhizobium sp.]|nr:Spy/CpxP family protein refolding chaperone [Mesorhizobium sp.]MBL8575760.1 Spy/CpxP family protein refolding chaperone [Mesorhizobium sp.]
MLRNTLMASAAALVLLTGSAIAQEAEPPEPADIAIVDIYTEGDAAAVLAARIAALKTVLELTPDQEKLWDPVEASIRQVAADSAKRRAERAAAEPPADFLTILDRIADAEAVRATDLKAFVAAARPLVDSLSDEQKRRAPAFLGLTESGNGPQPTSQLWLFEEEEG